MNPDNALSPARLGTPVAAPEQLPAPRRPPARPAARVVPCPPAARKAASLESRFEPSAWLVRLGVVAFWARRLGRAAPGFCRAARGGRRDHRHGDARRPADHRHRARPAGKRRHGDGQVRGRGRDEQDRLPVARRARASRRARWWCASTPTRSAAPWPSRRSSSRPPTARPRRPRKSWTCRKTRRRAKSPRPSWPWTLAKLDREKYLEGEYKVEVDDKKGAINLAERELKEAEEKLEGFRIFVKKGFGTPEQLSQKELEVAQKKNNLERDKAKLMVLEKFTRRTHRKWS